jgi:hypothetical protein
MSRVLLVLYQASVGSILGITDLCVSRVLVKTLRVRSSGRKRVRTEKSSAEKWRERQLQLERYSSTKHMQIQTNSLFLLPSLFHRI